MIFPNIHEYVVFFIFIKKIINLFSSRHVVHLNESPGKIKCLGIL